MVRRQPLIPEYENWMAVEDARGQWTVVTERLRLEPLRNPEPYARMMAVHLAASAPCSRAVCTALAPRLESSGWADHDRRHRHLVDALWGSLIYSRPVGSTLARILPVSGVLEIPLDTIGDKSAA
jgi:hypothetical protein